MDVQTIAKHSIWTFHEWLAWVRPRYRDRVERQRQNFEHVIDKETKVVQLNWINDQDGYYVFDDNLIEMQSAWSHISHLVARAKGKTKGGLTHVLLDNFPLPDGLHNLLIPIHIDVS